MALCDVDVCNVTGCCAGGWPNRRKRKIREKVAKFFVKGHEKCFADRFGKISAEPMVIMACVIPWVFHAFLFHSKNCFGRHSWLSMPPLAAQGIFLRLPG